MTTINLVDKYLLEYAFKQYLHYEVEWFSLRNRMSIRVYNELIDAYPELSGSMRVWIDEHSEYREMPKMRVKVPKVAMDKVKKYLEDIYDNVEVVEWVMVEDY